MKKFNILFLLLTLAASAAFAKKYTNEQKLSNSAIVATAVIPVMCEGYSSLKQTGNPALATPADERGFILQHPYALIRLSVPQHAANPASATATVNATVTYEYEKTGQILTGHKDITLSIEINSATFKDIDYVKIDGALKAEVQITSVNNIGLFPKIELTASCEGEIYRFLPPYASVSGAHYTAPSIRTDGSLADGNLFVSWDDALVDGSNNILSNAGVEAYELEWTYVSNQGVTEGATLAKNQIYLRDYLFRNNSSRVVTVNKGYFIPLVYEKGLIIFRVRPVGKNIVNGTLTDVRGAWTILENQTSLSNVPDAYIYTFSGLENNLNWQSSISFAEEGKNKTVVSYHDGSLRNRQAVTKINTDERAIAGETFYDYNGRPVIQTLPVPVEGIDENNLNYRPHFNVRENKDTLAKSDYDTGDQGQGCSPVAPKLSTATGASKYYSGNNQFGTTGNTGQNILNRDYIPDAKKYPYTQTLYTNDNTGRVSAQSGVGDAHILGSGHETKYMYGAPLQGELSRLFGNQVGVGGHYKKNSVIDPNGQVSVSYLDLDGKVIATALAGGNRTNLDDLPGDKTRTVSSNLISDVNNIPDSDSKGKTMLFSFPVTTEVPYTFTYDMTAGIHKVSCTGADNTPIELKLAGVFDATVSLYNSCNSLIFSESVSTNESFGTSAADQTRTITRTVPADSMKIGQYNLVKTVRLNQAKLDNYLTQYLSNKDYTCVLKDDYFLAHAFDQIDFSGCGITCSECRTRIDGLIQELENKQISLSGADKANLYERCDAICLDNSTCLSSLYNMTASMSPDGQYGQVRRTPPALDNGTNIDMNNVSDMLDVDKRDFSLGPDENGDPTISADNSIVPEEFPLSVFNDHNVLTPNQLLRTGSNTFYRADWRRPVQVNIPGNTRENYKNQLMFTENLSNATYTETEYKDEDGGLAYAYIQEVSQGVYSPAVVTGAPVTLESADTDPKLYKVPLKYLVDVKEFLKRWQPHFANYLVPYHPEFSYYVECSSRDTINSYEEKLIDYNSPTEDTSHAFLTTQTANGILYYVPDVLSKDPIFTDPSIPQALKDRLSGKVNQYQQKYTAAGVPVSPAEYYSMAQYSTVMINCPDPNAVCHRPNCDIGKYEADDIEEWMAFKTLYLTERQKILREVSTRNAIQGRYYNGCIGNASFNGSAEQKRMLTKYDYVPGLSELQARVNDICASPAVVPFPYNTFGWGRSYYGRRWSSYCNGLTQMVNSDYILRRFNAIPLYDPNQTCTSDKASLYAKKIRAFYPPMPDASPIGGNGESCYEIILDQDGNARYIKTECNMGMLDQGALISNADAVRSYQSCGLCPLVTQVEDLINELIDNQVLDARADSFNCVSKSPSFGLGRELQTYINSAFTSNTLLSWNGSFNSTSKVLTGTITPSPATGNNTLTMTLNFAGSGIADATWQDNTKSSQVFRRLHIASIVPDPSGVNNFRLKVYINLNRAMAADYTIVTGLLASADNTHFIPASNQSIYRYEFELPGSISYVTPQQQTSGIDLQHCTFKPLCSTSQYSSNILNILNTLVYKDDTDTDDGTANVPLKPYDLVPAAPLTIQDADIYDDPVRQLLGFTQTNADGSYTETIQSHEVIWTASVQGTGLAGVLSYKAGAAGKTLNVNIIPQDFTGKGDISNSVDFSRVSYFANIRPFDVNCITGKCNSNKFYADAVVQEGVTGDPNAYVFHRVVIELSSRTGGSLDPVQPVTTMCEKVGP